MDVSAPHRGTTLGLIGRAADETEGALSTDPTRAPCASASGSTLPPTGTGAPGTGQDLPTGGAVRPTHDASASPAADATAAPVAEQHRSTAEAVPTPAGHSAVTPDAPPLPDTAAIPVPICAASGDALDAAGSNQWPRGGGTSPEDQSVGRAHSVPTQSGAAPKAEALVPTDSAPPASPVEGQQPAPLPPTAPPASGSGGGWSAGGGTGFSQGQKHADVGSVLPPVTLVAAVDLSPPGSMAAREQPSIMRCIQGADDPSTRPD